MSKQIEKTVEAPFSFSFVERQLRKKNFGILTTIIPKGKPHSVGVVYAMPPKGQPFCLYLITRRALKKARNIRSNVEVSFVVPFPHYLFRMIPPACIQFQGRAEELIPIDDPIGVKAFQSSAVLRRSILHSTEIGESTFIRIIPDNKIFSFGFNANIWKYLIRAKNEMLGNFYVDVPQSRRTPG